MAPEKVVWPGRGFIFHGIDTMECKARVDGTGEGIRNQFVCTNETDSRIFECGEGMRLTECGTKLAWVGHRTGGSLSNPAPPVVPRARILDVGFFLDSNRVLRPLGDPLLGHFLASDSLASRQYGSFRLAKNVALIGSAASLAGVAGWLAVSVAEHDFAHPAALACLGVWAGGFGVSWYFQSSAAEWLEKSINTFNQTPGKKEVDR
jgi:hypothetical protein